MWPRRVADLIDRPAHLGLLADASAVGEAGSGMRLVVRIALREEPGGVQARFSASSCASLVAYAEAACALLEAGAAPSGLDPERLRAAVSGVHPIHHDRAELVSLAIARAASSLSPKGAATP